MNYRLIITISLLLTLGCERTSTTDVSPPMKSYKIGETVYVCGCPPVCDCCIIASFPGGNCACNMPLKLGTVVREKNGSVTIQLDGRQKTIFLQ